MDGLLWRGDVLLLTYILAHNRKELCGNSGADRVKRNFILSGKRPREPETAPWALLSRSGVRVTPLARIWKSRLEVLVRRFQKKIGKLLQVVVVEHAVIQQGIVHTPGFGDDDGGLVMYNFILYACNSLC